MKDSPDNRNQPLLSDFVKSFLSLLLVVCLASCSGQKNWQFAVPPEQEFTFQGQTYETIDSRVEELEEIRNFPLDFKLSYEEDRVAWERLSYYLSTYLKFHDLGLDQEGLTINQEGRNYHFKRTYSRENVQYNIQVTDSLTNSSFNQHSSIIAGNIARFLKTGVLNQDLLIQPISNPAE